MLKIYQIIKIIEIKTTSNNFISKNKSQIKILKNSQIIQNNKKITMSNNFISKLILIYITITKNTKTLNAGDITNLTKLCMGAISSAYPPEFCWKRGGDIGIIPIGCPDGYFRSVALCYEYCKKGYSFVLGVCWHDCQRGSDIGAFCVDWFYVHGKHSYIPKSLTNFATNIPCGFNQYRPVGSALCYRDCRKIGMVNCGIGACARDLTSCGGAVMNMFIETVNTITSSTLLVLSFGTSTAATAEINAGKKALQRLGTEALKKSFQGMKNYIKKKGIAGIKKKMQKYIREKIKEAVINRAISENITPICNSMLDNLADKTKKTTELDAVGFIKKFDVLDINTSVTNCLDTSTSNKKMDCATSIMNSLSNFDPTGFVALAASFVKPICNIPTNPNETSIKNFISYNKDTYKRRVFDTKTGEKIGKCGINESKNSIGSNRCNNNNDCNGARTCSVTKWCQGESRCEEVGINDCGVNERNNRLGPNKCDNDRECDGERTCSYYGWCRGDSKCDNCNLDEGRNTFGASKCRNDDHCKGKRYCSEDGWCQGEDGCG